MRSANAREPLIISDLLSCHCGGLAPLYNKAKELARIQQLIRSELPFPLRDHLFVAGCDDRCLLLLTDGPAWAARLRFQIPNVLALARRKCGLSSVQAVRIRVSVFLSLSAPSAKQPKLSASAAEALKRSAESLSDPGLRDCLLRLSRHR